MPSSCRPDPPDTLGQADVVGLKLVQAHTDDGGGDVEQPHGGLAGLGHAALGQVVGDDVLEAEVRMQQQRAAQDGVHDGVVGAGGEGRDSQRHQAGGQDALKGPVVVAVARGRGRDGGRVVDC